MKGCSDTHQEHHRRHYTLHDSPRSFATRSISSRRYRATERADSRSRGLVWALQSVVCTSPMADVRDRVLVAIAPPRYSECVRKMNLLWLAALALLPCSDVPRRAVVGGAPVTPGALAVNEETVAGRRHYARGYPADDGAGVYAVIEIPSGTTAKF